MMQYFSAILNCNKKGVLQRKREQQQKELNNKKIYKNFQQLGKMHIKNIINVLDAFFYVLCLNC